MFGKKAGDKYNEVPSRTSSAPAPAPHIYTLLVSGDTQPPISYVLIGSTINKKLSADDNNNNTPLESINIWKPNAPEGYVACGYVIDKRPYKGSNAKSKDPNAKSNAPQPPLDLIATIPEASLGEYPFNQFKFKTNDNKIGSFIRSNLNLFKRTLDTTTGTGAGGSTSCSTTGENCYECVSKPSTEGLDLKDDNIEVLGTVKKDKKYSILKIYE